MVPITWEDLRYLALTVWGEARGEDRAGQRAVALVVLARVADPRWPDTVKDVVLQRWQFSCWNFQDPNRTKLEHVGLSDRSFRQCVESSLEAIGLAKDVGPGPANHYLSTAITPPEWAADMAVVATIGRHRFYAG